MVKSVALSLAVLVPTTPGSEAPGASGGLAASSSDGAARTGTVEGRVVDAATQQPLPGAQILLEGVGLSSLTGADGQFTVEDVPAGSVTVLAELIGYRLAEETVQVPEDGTVEVVFELEEQALALDDLVVTGQAREARQREVGNVIAGVNTADVSEPVQSVETLLQGRVAGANVRMNAGEVGTGASIRLRGNVSATQGNQPIIYVDGVRQASDGYSRIPGFTGPQKQAGPLADINPEDVERVEVIKGAAASTLYGSEAAAGVIQIFTHRGESGDPQWSYRTDQSLSWVREWGSEDRPRLGMDPWLRRAYGQSHDLSVRGGADRVTYFVSGNLEDREGPLVDDEEERYRIRSNLSIDASESLSFDVNANFNRHQFEDAPSGNSLSSIFFNVYRAPNNFVGGAMPGEPEFKEQMDQLRERRSETTNQRTVLGLTGDWTPRDDFTTRVTLGYDRMDSDQETVLPHGYVTSPDGTIHAMRWTSESLTVDLASSYSRPIGDDLTTDLSVGGQFIREDETQFLGFGDGLPGPGRHTLDSAAETSLSQSGLRVNSGGVFADGRLGFRDRYFLNAGFRLDGNSAFGEDFGLEFYPKTSLSYVISDEDFWRSEWGQLRLRTAYGFAGRAPGAFDAVRTWSATSFVGRTAFSPANVGNPNLGPERTGELETGFEGSFLDDRLDVDFTYYRQVTENALFSVEQSPSLGFTGGQLENVGEIKNSGIELAANLRVLERPQFSWDVGADVTTNNSEILDTGPATSYILVEGQPAPVRRGAKVVNANEFADPEFEFDAFFGPTEPTHIINLSTSVTLPRGIRLHARGEYQGGHYMQEFASMLVAQRGPGAVGCDDVYRIVPHDEYTGPSDDHPDIGQVRAIDRARCYSESRSDVWIFPADFFRLREVTAEAPIPWEIPGTESAHFTISGRNLTGWETDGFVSHDPEIRSSRNQINSLTGGWVADNIPPPASVTMSLRVTF